MSIGFFIPLFELYVLFTVFVYFVNNKKHCLILFLVFLLGLNCVLNYFNIGSIVGYSFFAVFGFYVHKYGISRKLRIIFYVLAIFGFLANSFGSYYLSISAGKLIRTYIEYSFLPAMLYPCGLFVFIKYDLVKIMENDYVNRIVSFLRFLHIWNLFNSLVYFTNYDKIIKYKYLFNNLPIRGSICGYWICGLHNICSSENSIDKKYCSLNLVLNFLISIKYLNKNYLKL